MLLLFDQIVRNYQDPAQYSEGEFSFLNRSARPAASKVRNLLEEWFEQYPETEKPILRSRFRSEFKSAFYELLLYVFLSSIKCSVDLHPDTATNVGTKPDFLATLPDGTEVFIEARVISDVSESEASKQNQLNRLYDQLDQIESIDFFIGLKNLKDDGRRQPAVRKLRESIESWIKTLNPDEVANMIDEVGTDAAPSLVHKDNGFEVTVFVIPKKPEARGKPEVRPIGMFPVESRWGGTSPALKKGLSKKAGKYGKIQKPYVIAVNCISPWGLTSTDVIEALFGTTELYRLLNDNNFRPNSDGFWDGSRGIKNTRVSAVIISSVYPWNLPRASFYLFHNPFATVSCCCDYWKIRQVTATAGEIKGTEGTTLGDLFGIPPNWQGVLFND